MNKSVSVVLPTFNEEKNIRKCLDSLLKQDYKNIKEFIIVDGYSTDSTFEILKEYVKKNHRIKVYRIKHKAKGKIAEACNFGLSKAKGYFVCIPEADAVYEKNFVSESVKKINSDEKLAGVCPQTFYPGKKFWIKVANLLRQSRVFLGEKPHSGKLYKKHLLEEVGCFNEESIWGEDNAITLELRKRGYKVEFVGPQVLWWHDVSGRFDSNLSFIKETFLEAAKNISTDLLYPKRLVRQSTLWLVTIFLAIASIFFSQLVLLTIIFFFLATSKTLYFLYGALHFTKDPLLLLGLFFYNTASVIMAGLGRIAGLFMLVFRRGYFK